MCCINIPLCLPHCICLWKEETMNIHKKVGESIKCCLVWFISWTLHHRAARGGKNGLNGKDIERDREKAADESRMQGL